jgi:hypothetical protein
MSVYAAGTKAWAICDRCGLRGRHLEMLSEAQTGLRVHPACADEPYVPRKRPPEGIALRHPRPDTNLAEPYPGFERDPEIYGDDTTGGMVPNPPSPTVEED